MGHRLPRFIVEGIVFLLLIPVFCLIDGSLLFYFALNLPPERAWIVRALAYPGALFSSEGYTAIAINGVCWSFAVVFLIECLFQFVRFWRAKALKDSD